MQNGIIVGSVIGGVVFIFAITIMTICLCHQCKIEEKRKKNEKVVQNPVINKEENNLNRNDNNNVDNNPGGIAVGNSQVVIPGDIEIKVDQLRQSQ
jgi:hypothetical protein